MDMDANGNDGIENNEKDEALLHVEPRKPGNSSTVASTKPTPRANVDLSSQMILFFLYF